jgi:hypothetical protein
LTARATWQTASSSPSTSTTAQNSCPTCEKLWVESSLRLDLQELTKLDCHRLIQEFQLPSYRLYQAQLVKLRAVLVRKLTAGPSKEELDDLNGQLFNLRVVEQIPQQIERELQRILEREKQNTELKELQNARSAGVRS